MTNPVGRHLRCGFPVTSCETNKVSSKFKLNPRYFSSTEPNYNGLNEKS